MIIKTKIPHSISKNSNICVLDSNNQISSEYLKVAGDGGLLRNEDNLVVDLNNYSIAKKEKFYSDMRLFRKLEGTQDFWVDLVNGNDVIVDNIGTENNPFRSIQNCINYIVGTYFLVNSTTTIHILNNIYNEALYLYDFLGVNSKIYLVGESRDDTIIKNTTPVRVLGGNYSISNLSIVSNLLDTTTSGLVSASGINMTGGNLEVTGIRIDSTCTSEEVAGARSIYCFLISGGVLTFNNSMDCVLTVNSGSATDSYVFRVSNSSLIKMNGNNQHDGVVEYSGLVNVFASASFNSSIIVGTGYKYNLKFSTTEPILGGKRFSCMNSSLIYTGNQGLNFFPGVDDGVVDEKTYCSYV